MGWIFYIQSEIIRISLLKDIFIKGYLYMGYIDKCQPWEAGNIRQKMEMEIRLCPGCQIAAAGTYMKRIPGRS